MDAGAQDIAAAVHATGRVEMNLDRKSATPPPRVHPRDAPAVREGIA
jgi:hypothetical protein